MAVNLKLSEVPSREQRLGSITGYDGSLKDLATQGCAGCLRNKQRGFQTVSNCAHIHCINQLAGLEGTLVVDHAPVGCAGAQICFTSVKSRVPAPPGALQHAKVISSAIGESDTVFGALDKLRETVIAANERHNPREIYIATSCVSAIIGEDVNSVCTELSEELGKPVVMAQAEGLKSKIWASGFDAYCHAASRARLIDTKKRNNTVNFVGFSNLGKQYVEPLLARLGLELICLTATASVEDFERACSSVASWGQCGAQSSYLCSALEEKCGVKYFQSHLPYGGVGFERFFLDLGRYIGKEDEAKQVIAEEKEKYRETIEKAKKILAGKRAFVALGASFAYEYTRLLYELGVEVPHAVAYHYDPKLDNPDESEKIAAATDVIELNLDVETSVNDGQVMETRQLIKKYNPDVIITRGHDANIIASSFGIPAYACEIGLILMGYRGLALFATTLADTLANTNLQKQIAKHYKQPFTEKLENTAPHSFYKEVAV
ncbi:MAG: oxidoreductase [Oscillospiraceae bacterium]|jgi:nitrogenase molybdenum-iron protein alpha chain|nr:oxidoreductase [Oscillospiraceae bacterium]